jgi:Mg-chelatase subunit ChlD
LIRNAHDYSQVSDGYFVHFINPDEKQFKTLRKHVVFVIDLSGSMYGTKLQQTKDAMKVILKEMDQTDDYLSIVTFSSGAKVGSNTA